MINEAVLPGLEEPLPVLFDVGVQVAAEYRAAVSFQVSGVFMQIPASSGLVAVDVKQAGTGHHYRKLKAAHHLLPQGQDIFPA